MTARSTSTSRASCCCPCGLVPVVTVAAGTRWGDATPCYASHHIMLVLLYGLAHNTYPTLKPRHFFHTKTKISRTSTQTHRRSVFFFLYVAIRNSLRSNKGKNGSSKIFANDASLFPFSISLLRSCCGVHLFLDDEDRCSGQIMNFSSLLLLL